MDHGGVYGGCDESNRKEKACGIVHAAFVCAVSILIPSQAEGTTLWKFAIALLLFDLPSSSGSVNRCDMIQWQR